MAKLSESFEAKLGRVLSTGPDVPNISVESLIRIATSPTGFKSESDFREYITEGLTLHVTDFASSYLGIPGGEYMVKQVRGEKAVLVPLADDLSRDLTEAPKKLDIQIAKLAGHWNKLERCLSEAEEGGNKERVQQQRSKYPRNDNAKGAIESTGRSQEDVAEICGVHPSTVCRWTIDSEKGGRTPNLDHALALAAQTGQDVSSLFGNKSQKPSRSARRRTSGSGGGRNPTFRGQGE